MKGNTIIEPLKRCRAVVAVAAMNEVRSALSTVRGLSAMPFLNSDRVDLAYYSFLKAFRTRDRRRFDGEGGIDDTGDEFIDEGLVLWLFLKDLVEFGKGFWKPYQPAQDVFVQRSSALSLFRGEVVLTMTKDATSLQDLSRFRVDTEYVLVNDAHGVFKELSGSDRVLRDDCLPFLSIGNETIEIERSANAGIVEDSEGVPLVEIDGHKEVWCAKHVPHGVDLQIHRLSLLVRAHDILSSSFDFVDDEIGCRGEPLRRIGIGFTTLASFVAVKFVLNSNCNILGREIVDGCILRFA